MNKQVCDCLRILMDNNEKSVSIDELSARMNVSIRTIRNYSAEIESFLAKNQKKSTFYCNNSVLRFTGSNEEQQKICKAVTDLDFYSYRLNLEERQDILAFYLLSAQSPATLKELENLFYIGRSTLISDFNILTERFQKNSITFSENKHKGFIIDCKESIQRNMLFSTFKKICRLSSYPWNDRLCDTCIGYSKRILKIDQYCQSAEKAIRYAEQSFEVTLLDDDFYDLTIMLCIAMKRISENCFIENDFILQDLTYTLPIDIMDCVYKQIYPETPSETEVLYMGEKLMNRHPNFMETLSHGEHINFSIVIKSLLYRLSDEYGIDLFGDSVLHSYLTSHVFRIYHRIQEGQPVNNPFKNELITEYPKDYEILCSNIDILENGLHCRFDADAITDVLAHILAVLERSYQDTVIPDVIISCDSGLGTANFLASKVKKSFGVNITAISSSHNIQSVLLKQNCDFVLSTVPLINVPVPWIQVSPALTQKDLREIRAMLFDTRKKACGKHVYNAAKNSENAKKSIPVDKISDSDNLSFSSLLTPGHILLNKNAADWKQAIRIAGTPMQNDHKITQNYIEAMVENVVENGPYIVFVPGVAIAHASAVHGALDISASILRLAKPVKFGHDTNDPVRFVVALSIDKDMRHMNAFLDALTIFCNSEAISEMDIADDEEAILNVIYKYEAIGKW